MARTKPTDDSITPKDGVRPAPAPAEDGSYTVVARRYRPQTFSDVVGQDHVVQALRNAVTMNRVTHAYLFSGTRGVGKTSIARIFAKCLNCVKGPTVEPCNECDICRAISVGQDVDVIEIDGASSNGVEDVRNLRQNAGLRPSRARFKIYYIDEVHMLSTGAFNALLKTLEEPPEHLKFFFATTEPNKIPITVLSRCQRFDFAGITAEQIAETLGEICEKEGVKATPEALATIARRASGSMRDSQSLLEQMLSYGGVSLTDEIVHKALGIAPDERILDLIDALADRDLPRVLGLVESSAKSGVQPADLLNGAMGFLRDVMVTQVGPNVPLLYAAPSQKERLKNAAERTPLDTVIAALQILADARGRMRFVPEGRLLVELALARIARLENFSEISELIARLDGQGSPSVKKKPVTVESTSVRTPGTVPASSRATVVTAPPVEPPSVAPSAPKIESVPTATPTPPLPQIESVPTTTPTAQVEPEAAVTPRAPAPLTLDSALEVWRGSLSEKLPFRLRMTASRLTPNAIEPPGVLVVPVPARYNGAIEDCESNRALIESALSQLLGRAMTIRLFRDDSSDEEATPVSSARASTSKMAEFLAADPWVQDVIRTFETAPFPMRVDSEEDTTDS